MNDKLDEHWLTGRLLIAMPNLSDPRFHHAVILVCAHDAKGAMGFVLNHEMSHVPLETLLAELSIAPDGELAGQLSEPCTLLSGGPVEMGRGYLLHSPDYTQAETVQFAEGFCLTATVQAVQDVVAGRGPREKLLILGYAGWDEAQLEKELKEGSWLVADPTPDFVFNEAADDKWASALKSLGIDPGQLSGAVGNA